MTTEKENERKGLEFLSQFSRERLSNAKLKKKYNLVYVLKNNNFEKTFAEKEQILKKRKLHHMKRRLYNAKKRKEIYLETLKDTKYSTVQKLNEIWKNFYSEQLKELTINLLKLKEIEIKKNKYKLFSNYVEYAKVKQETKNIFQKLSLVGMMLQEEGKNEESIVCVDLDNSFYILDKKDNVQLKIKKYNEIKYNLNNNNEIMFYRQNKQPRKVEKRWKNFFK